MKDPRKGGALILLMLMMILVVIPLVGLAIDGSIAYLIRTRLSAALDAAALAGARSLSSGLDIASQTASVNATVASYMNANFPNGLYRTTNLTVSPPVIAESAYKTRTVTVTATVSYPTYFMGLIGYPAGQSGVAGQASRRDVNVMMVLDRSGSLAGAPCTGLKSAAQAFSDKFVNERDRVGLITFKASSHLDFAPSLNFKTETPNIRTIMGEINCAGNTGTAQALSQAYQQIKAINEPGALNLIVFFTDGLPNGIAAKFLLKQAADTRYDVSNTSALVSTPPTTCQDTPDHSLSGVVAQDNGAPTGSTYGLMDTAGTVITSTRDPLISAPGCQFAQRGSNYIRRDIATYFTTPPVDLYGNAIATSYKPIATYPAGPYQGTLRIDTPAAIENASYNAAESAARTIRNDTTFSPVIYSIGFASDVDPDFLRRVANDSQSKTYDSSRPAGLYVFAPNASQLSTAFNRVASEILRLAQ